MLHRFISLPVHDRVNGTLCSVVLDGERIYKILLIERVKVGASIMCGNGMRGHLTFINEKGFLFLVVTCSAYSNYSCITSSTHPPAALSYPRRTTPPFIPFIWVPEPFLIPSVLRTSLYISCPPSAFRYRLLFSLFNISPRFLHSLLPPFSSIFLRPLHHVRGGWGSCFVSRPPLLAAPFHSFFVLSTFRCSPLVH
jgi:hypothetical protein